jgi:peptide/nickel transport system substrate-binding protein
MQLALRRRRVMTAPLALAAVATADAQTVRQVVIGQGFLTDSLDPANGSAGWALQSHGVAETLFAVDRDGLVVPQLAQSLTREGERWVVTLRPGLRFSDGSALDAAAVKAALDRSIAQNPRAKAQAGSLVIEPVTAERLIVAPERPVPAMDSLLAEFPMVIYRAEAGRFVFSGPFQVAEFRRGELLRLEPNAHHRAAGARPPVTIRRIVDPQTLALGLESGEIDLAFNLATETLPRLRRRHGLTIRSTAVAYQYMLLINTLKAPFDDLRVRRALDLALDRDQLVTALGAGEPATGLYPRFMPYALTERLAHDAASAERLLDDAGWRRARAGASRERDGRPLEITLVNYPQRVDFLTLTPVLRAQLEAVGFVVRSETVENITAHLQQRRFDVAFWTMHVAPGGDGGFVLEQYLRASAPLNVMGYRSPALDRLLDRLRETEGAEPRARLIREIQGVLRLDVPMSFLMTPVWHVGLSARLAEYVPFPTDYYIVRADLAARN